MIFVYESCSYVDRNRVPECCINIQVNTMGYLFVFVDMLNTDLVGLEDILEVCVSVYHQIQLCSCQD